MHARTGEARPHHQGYRLGNPIMMEAYGPFQILVTPEETLIVNSYRDIRHVAVQPPNVVLGTPPDSIPIPLLTAKARFTERIRKSAPDRMEMQMTIEDSGALSKPWVFTVGYRRAMGQDRMFRGVFDNDRSVVDADGDLLTISPPQR